MKKVTVPKLLTLFTMACLFGGPLPAARGAQPPDPPSSDRSAADQKWSEIQTLVAPPPAGRSATPRSGAGQRQEMAALFGRAADESRAFYESHPGHPQAAEARLLEVKSLLNVAMAGVHSRAARTASLVEEIRRDETLPGKSRLQVAALADVVRLRPLAVDLPRFLAGHEESARRLIAEFPNEAGGYELLFRQAENQPEDAEGIRIAREVLALPAPPEVKDKARGFLDRQALVGQSLPAVVGSALDRSDALGETAGQGIVLYAWATTSPGSVTRAKSLATMAAAGTVLVGVNLDTDVAAAKALAATEQLPGTQLYDEQGLEGPLARALRLSTVRHIYVADRQGVIREVSAEHGDLTRKFGAAAR